VLLSALLTYQTLSPAPNNDIAWAVQIQTFAATAWYHKKLGPELQQKALKDVVAEAKVFALGDYMLALTKGNTLTDAERRVMAGRLAEFTGLSSEFILSANLRVSSGRFRKELLRDQYLVVGRLDSRFTALDLDAAGESQEFDPSNTALKGAYVAMFQDYIKNELKWDSDLRYPTSGDVRPWTYVQNRYMDTTDALRQTMAINPFLKLMLVSGYYDMATYVGGAEFNLTHLAYDRQITDRVSYGYYEGGHMMYIRPSAHAALKKDLVSFIRSATASK
jgi:carboxypeptidase C (cathepsin A)